MTGRLTLNAVDCVVSWQDGDRGSTSDGEWRGRVSKDLKRLEGLAGDGDR